MSPPASLTVAWLCVCVLVAVAANPLPQRPEYTEYARMARWLVHVTDWGVLATVTADGHPLSGVESFSDGPADTSTGRVFFYMTPMDETTTNIMARPNASFTVTEAQLLPRGCGTTDPEDPTCAKLSILGEVRPVLEADQKLASSCLFSKHPAMESWPVDHGFAMYELHVKALHLLDYYGGMHRITPEDYFKADPLASQLPQRAQQLLGQGTQRHVVASRKLALRPVS